MIINLYDFYLVITQIYFISAVINFLFNYLQKLNCKIPKCIIQTGYEKDNSILELSLIKEMNKDYRYEYYNDDDSILFLKKYFDEKVLKAYHKLKPGAFKADLFRYCYLYIKGGIYIDLDLLPLVKLDDIIKNSCDFISAYERRNIPGIYQAFIACKPKIYFFKKAIDMIVENTENNYYPPINKIDKWISILAVTGPVLLANAMEIKVKEGFSKKYGLKIYLYKFTGNICDNNKVIIKNGTSYKKKTNYAQMFKKRDIYN